MLLQLAATLASAVEGWKPLHTVPLAADVHHVQGIDVEGTRLWVSSVDRPAAKGYLTVFDLVDGRMIQQVEVQEGQRIHPGGITLDGDAIWIPVAEYDRDGPTTIQRRDKQSLRVAASFEVADHIGCIAAGPAHLAGGNWDSRIIYRWSRDGRELGRTRNPRPAKYQDVKILDGLLVGSGDLSKSTGAIEWLALPDLKLIRRVQASATPRGVPYTHEGMTIRGGKLYLLPEDHPSTVYVFTPGP
ncbi:MAG: hypothetical protein FJW39_18785 [Acidobacteria bacterium]|nr:hypothetical protein [Acidobacteriota bacterium]